MTPADDTAPESPPDAGIDRKLLRKRLLGLALPSIGEYILKMMMGVVDTAFLGRVGPEALAVSGLSWSILFYFTMPLFGMSAGVSAIVARYVGAGDRKNAARAAGQALLINVAASSLITLVLILFAGDFLRLMGASPQVAQKGARFLCILSSTFIFTALMFAANDILKAAGDTRTPMLIIGLVNVLNTWLAYCLLYGKMGFPNHGVMGVAEASAAMRALGAFLSFGGLMMGWFRLKVGFADIATIDREMIARILRIGGPSTMESIFFSVAATAFTWVVTSLGTESLAAHNVLMQAESFSYMPGIGFSVASGILVGQALGEGDRAKARAAAWEGARIGTLIMGSMGLVFFFFPESVVRIFTDSPPVVDISSRTLRIVGLIQPVQGLMFCLLGALRGAGDTATTMKISLAGTWLVRFPGAYVMVKFLGAGIPGAWGGMCIDIAFRTLLLLRRIQKDGWDRIKV
jgi:putative MATE family efflux protein